MRPPAKVETKVTKLRIIAMYLTPIYVYVKLNANHLHLSNMKVEEQKLKKAGLKITKARLEILKVMENHRKPLTIKQIKNFLQPKIDLVTIYRNVETLAKLGILRKVLITDSEAFYEYNHGHHHHFICQNCGTIEDFEVCNTESLIKAPLSHSKKFAFVLDHQLELFGLCKICAK